MSREFATRVDQGLYLSRRLYYGKGVTPPVIQEPPPKVRCSPENLMPTAAMAYASISDPSAVDNPDVPSYQPYVHSRCEPAALVPLQMLAAELSIDSWLDTAVVTFTGRWRVHCLMACRRTNCCVAIPMWEKVSLLDADVDILNDGISYKTKLVAEKDLSELEIVYNEKESRLLNPHFYAFEIPQVYGGSILSVQVTWSQKLVYREGQFHLKIPFKFPQYVTPVGNDITKIEKVTLNVNSGILGEVIVSCTSHPLKVLHREVGRLSCLYQTEVLAWSKIDFSVSFSVRTLVSSDELSGNLLVKSPAPWDSGDNEVFCLYLLPGTGHHRQVFKRRVVFVIDTSGSMEGDPIQDVKKALLASLAKLNLEDAFNIIGFSDDVRRFSASMELATSEAISSATQWVSSNLIASGKTNILVPLKQAIKMLEGGEKEISFIFLVTDGSVENEREICDAMKRYYCCRNEASMSPRICTFGIGLYCNHYFLQMLTQIGRGYYDGVYGTHSIEPRMTRLFETASSIIIANTTLDFPKHLSSVEVIQARDFVHGVSLRACISFDSPLSPCLWNSNILQLFPSKIPDITLENPLVISGRYKGQFPDSVEVRGTLPDMSCLVMELTVVKTKDIALDKILAKRQIDELTARAWYEDKPELQEKVTELSIQTGFPCEYTQMVLLKQDDEIIAKPLTITEILRNPSYKINEYMQKKRGSNILMGTQSLGFGNADATARNIPPGKEEAKNGKGGELLVRVASQVMDRVCCICCLRCVSGISGQCTVVCSQICAALACFECLSCCFEVCGCLEL